MPTFAPLRKIVKRLVGRDDTSLTLEEAKAAKEINPEVYKDYLVLRREYNAEWKALMHKYIASKPRGIASYPEVIRFLSLKGFDGVLPQGFNGLINKDGKLYTSKGKLIDGIPAAITFPNVRMNPNYGDGAEGNNWVFQAIRTNGGPGPYFYTTEFKNAVRKEKFTKVQALDVDAIRKKWLPMVTKFKADSPACVASVVLELLYQFSARIGTPNNTTFGISTLLKRHVFPTEQGLTLKYKGKDGVLTTHKLVKTDPVHKFLIKAINELTKDKDIKDRVFTIDRGTRHKLLTPTAVNRLWRALGGGDTSVHKIRTAAGTKLFYDLVTKLLMSPKKPKNQKEAREAFKVIVTKVGKLLNHVRRTANGTSITGATAMNSYIDTVLQIAYFKELGVPLPKVLEKFDN